MKQFWNKRNTILTAVILLVSAITLFGIIEDKRGIFHDKERITNAEMEYDKQEHDMSALTKEYKSIHYKISYVLIHNQNNKNEIREEMFQILKEIRQFIYNNYYEDLIKDDYRMLFDNIINNKRLKKLQNNNQILMYNLEIHV